MTQIISCRPGIAGATVPRDVDESADNSSLPLKVIEPASGWQLLNLGELWRYRELLYFFAWRDVKVRYKQTLLGAGWAIIQPLLMMAVFTIFLSRMAGIESGDIPYPLFVYAGLLPWMLFATGIASAGNSVVSSESIITKIYFPRLLVPFASVAAAVVDSACALAVLFVMLLYYRIWPGWSILLVPGIIGLTSIAALGVGTLLAALNVAYRDVKYVIPFLVQMWMFATPAIYMQVEPVAQEDGLSVARPSAIESGMPAPAVNSGGREASLSANVKALLALNPMNSMVAFFRAAVLGRRLPWSPLLLGVCVSVSILVLAVLYFRRVESTFADVI